MLKPLNKVFLRNPKRKIPGGNNIISPADGKIVQIIHIQNNLKKETVIKKGALGKIKLLSKDIDAECYAICIMMHIHNIHIQRAPIAGTITRIKHTPGSFRNAVRKPHLLGWINNEKNEIKIHSKKYNLDVKVIQIAGAVAKRIAAYVKKGEEVKKGEDLGHIALGSQVVLIVPKHRIKKLLVSEGTLVKDGETILAELITRKAH
ncbi:MAG: phosphatidylserine decarboxylase [Candidatus Nanoarchaeia archaeon]